MADDVRPMEERTVKCPHCEASFVGSEDREQAMEMMREHRRKTHVFTPTIEGLAARAATREPVQFQISGLARSAGESSVWQRLPKAIGVLTDAGFEVTLVEVYREDS